MTSYLIAGASRGIGLALVQKLASLPDTSVVYAGVRNPRGTIANDLKGDKIRPIQLDITSQSSVDAAVAQVKSDIASLDVLIISAGIAIGSYAYLDTADDLQKSLDTNTVGAYRAIIGFLPLIRASKAKKIIAIGTGGASFGIGQPLAKIGVPLGVYGASKAALHMLIMILGAELAKEGVITASVNPGIVATDMSRERMSVMGPEVMEQFQKMGLVPISAEESAERILRVVGEVDAERSGGFMEWEGGLKILPF